VAIVSPDHGSLLSGEVAFRAHLVQPQEGESVELSVAGGDWRPMAEIGTPFYRSICEATCDTRDLPDGLVQVRVRSVPGGETRTRPFVIANGQPSAPATVDATLTFSVGTVIGAALCPTSPVRVMVNGDEVGRIAAGHKGQCGFQVSALMLRKVNVLTFDRAAPSVPFTITHPFLTLGETVIEDPTSAEVRRVQLNHWDEKTVSRAGFVIGPDPYETSFCMSRERFYFVLPDADGE